MRHTVHIMLGSNAEQVLTDVKKYVIKYGSEKENAFFNAMLYGEQGGEAGFYLARQAQTDATRFVAGIDNLYDIEYDEFCSIPSDSRSAYLQAAFTDLYNKKITINNPGDSTALHLCFYLPVYDYIYWERVSEFLSAIEAVPQQFEVDLFMLPADLAFLLEREPDTLPMKMAQYEQQTKQTIESILASKNDFRSLSNLILVQNCNSEGLSLNLNEDSFVRIIGEFALLTVSHYNEMFNPAAQDSRRPIYALGLSVLSFDKYYFVQYLLHKAYIHILDREHIMQDEVDVNKVSQIVQGILANNVKVFSHLYDTAVKPLLEKKMDQDAIIAQIHPALTREIDRLTAECQSFIDSADLSLPEKKATLAQLLGEDDDLLIGYMFNKQQLVIDDCSREVLDFFVDANNALFRMKEPIHPTDSAREVVRKTSRNLIAEKAVLSVSKDEQMPTASEMIDSLKEVKVAMRESSNYIRLKTGELQALGEQISEHEQSQKRLTDKGFVFDGQTYQLLSDVIEKPLEEDYKPMQNMPQKADLRPFFTPVKSQGALGACSAFALVSIYEYILRKNHQQMSDLSESFVYYNARCKNNNATEDSGSSLYDVVVTMGTEGVCAEELCPYTEELLVSKPSVEAYEDALQRKIVKALNVQNDLTHIKSAVAEGYPVAVSLRIFESFDPVGGFISRPTEDEIQSDETGNHAMVVCGYSDEEKVFIVRNSWGTHFGDQGYCYIPYSYFEDFLNVACIITQINTADIKVKGNNGKMTVSFDTTDTRIKSAILRNIIEEEKQHLSQLENILRKNELAYNQLFQALGNNSNRTTICSGTLERLQLEGEEHTKAKEDLQKRRTVQLKLFRRETLFGHIKYGISFALFIVFYIVMLFGVKIPPEILFFNRNSYIAYGVLAITIVLYVLWIRKRNHDYVALNEEFIGAITREEQSIAHLLQQLEVTKLKSHIAGMIIDSLARLFRNLHSKYNGMRSCVGNLRTWREEETADGNMSDSVREPFLSLISNDCLDRYFLTCKDKITESIQLSRMFKDTYQVAEEEIVKFKNNLKDSILQSLFHRLDTFSVFRHIVGESNYEYVDSNHDNLDALLQQMDRKSEKFVRTRLEVESAEAMNASCKLLFINTDFNADRVRWKAICDKNFQIAPTLCKDDSPMKITLLQLNALRPEEIALLQ